MTTQTSNAILVSRFINLRGEHESAGLDPRDLPNLSTPAPRKRAETAAQLYERVHGKPYTGKHGHVSIE